MTIYWQNFVLCCILCECNTRNYIYYNSHKVFYISYHDYSSLLCLPHILRFFVDSYGAHAKYFVCFCVCLCSIKNPFQQIHKISLSINSKTYTFCPNKGIVIRNKPSIYTTKWRYNLHKLLFSLSIVCTHVHSNEIINDSCIAVLNHVHPMKQ